MADETLLSDLCSICNTQKSKYRCPGCSARTCSLPCYKRHQQWAQCSGKRDPAAFVKKSQLATPAGIDHDFNFLTGIERNLERAEEEASRRGLDKEGAGEATGNVHFTKQKKGELHPKVLEGAGITLIKAPKGLSRQRENNSHRNKKKNIIWTVEWFHPDRTRSVREVSETRPLLEAYQDLFGPKREKRRKLDVEGHHQSSVHTTTEPETDRGGDAKRQKTLPAKEKEDQSQEHPVGQISSRGGEIAQETAPPMPEDDVPVGPEAETTTNSEDVNTTEPSASATDGLEPLPPAPQLPPTQEPLQPQQQETLTDSEPQILHFFLHRPLSRNPHPVLIRLDSSLPLSALLRDRTILEFPTIYVFSSASPPKEEFILEEEYLARERGEEKALDEVLGTVKRQAGKGDKHVGDESSIAGPTGEEPVDERKIVEVLKRDLGGKI